jgi:hypothetical protein
MQQLASPFSKSKAIQSFLTVFILLASSNLNAQWISLGNYPDYTGSFLQKAL